MLFAMYLITYLIEVHFSEFLLHFLFLLLLNVDFLLVLSDDLVDPLALIFEFVVALMVHGLLLIGV